MSDVNYFEIIKNKLDALVDKIIQRESSDENFRMTYAQILEKINTKMDIFSSSDEIEKIELVRSEIKNLILEKDEALGKNFKVILQEFNDINEEMKGCIKNQEMVLAFQTVQKHVKYFSEEIESQRASLNSMISCFEKFGTLETTNRFLESEFSIVKEQNAIINDNLISQMKLLNEHSSEYDNKFLELISTINADLNCILEQNKSLPQKGEMNLVLNKIEEVKLELEHTKAFISGINNNLVTLIDVVDNIFQNEEFEKIQDNIADILVNTSILSEAVQKLGSRDDILQCLSGTNVELKNHTEELIKNLEERMLEKLDFSVLDSIKDYTEKMFYQGTEVLKEEIWTIKDTVIEVKENIGSINDSIGNKLDGLRDEIADTLSKESIAKAYQFENITDTVIQKQASKIDEAKEEITDIISVESIAASKQISSISSAIEELKNDVAKNDAVEGTLSNFKKQFVSQLVQVAENISFVEEAEDLHNHIYDVSDEIKEKISTDISEITKLLEKIDEKVQEPDTEQKEAFDNLIKELRILTTGTNDENYAYTLPDVESDLSKIRLDLSNISKTLVDNESVTEENISDIYSGLNSLQNSIEKLENSPVVDEINDVKSLFTDLNNDISSISKRTNKLIITSDEVNKTLQKHIDEFTSIVQNFDTISQRFNDDALIVNLLKKIENITKISNSLVSSDKVLNEAFMYLAEWIDSTSDSFNGIKDDISSINEKLNEPDDNASRLVVLSEKVDRQEESIRSINQKLDSLLEQKNDTSEMKSLLEFIASQVSVANEKISEQEKTAQKIESIEKQIKKIEKNVSLLASYVEDED